MTLKKFKHSRAWTLLRPVHTKNDKFNDNAKNIFIYIIIREYKDVHTTTRSIITQRNNIGGITFRM